MLGQLKMVWEARSWMKKNEAFLPTWHAYVGYKLDLFSKLSNRNSISALAKDGDYDQSLIECWVDVGLTVGHLKRSRKAIVPKKRMVKYFSKDSPFCIGELVKEILELHMPALMEYPELLKGEDKKSYYGDMYGQTVAETSSLIEKRAFSKIYKELKRHRVSSVLDVGCGTGSYSLKLAKKLKKGTLTGVDLNQQVIEEANKEARNLGVSNVHFFHSSVEDWDVTGDPFDAIMLNNLLHYYSPESRLDLLNHIKNLLSDKGMIFIVTPLYFEKSGRRFSTAFNAFMNAHDNLHALPRKEELADLAEELDMTCHSVKTIVGEGSWYLVCLQKKKRRRG